jgi:chemotaxis methyl-accepting protein methylase
MGNYIEEIVELLLVSYNLDIRGFDNAFVEKSIDRRLSADKDITPNNYLALLRNDREEVTHLIDSLHVSYSEFFRNPLTFAYLEQFVLPLFKYRIRKETKTELRIWSAACASGQEAYSVAILLDEMNQESSGKFNFRIFASDNNAEELERARQGIFNPASLQKISLKRIQKYFVQKDENYSISSSIKKLVDFSWFDLLDEQPASPVPSIYGNFDLVICSNLLFYYAPASRKRILEKIKKNMAPGAFLVTGETERDILMKNGFSEIYENSAIFQEIYSNKQLSIKEI